MYRYSLYWYLFDGESKLGAYYLSTANGIFIEISTEKNNPRNPYTTWFHENGHWTDNNAADVEKGISIYKDSVESISMGPYADEFYDILVQECEAIKNAKNGSSFNAMDSINTSKDPYKISEFTDLMGATYKYNQKAGFLGHEDSYWNYDSKNNPSKVRLNKEAFAHFTQITAMQDTNDLKILKKHFPKSYQVYINMLNDTLEGKNN